MECDKTNPSFRLPISVTNSLAILSFNSFYNFIQIFSVHKVVPTETALVPLKGKLKSDIITIINQRGPSFFTGKQPFSFLRTFNEHRPFFRKFSCGLEIRIKSSFGFYPILFNLPRQKMKWKHL